MNPEHISLHSGRKVGWICEKGHKWSGTVASRTDNRHPHRCPVCAGQKVVAGINDLFTTDIEAKEYWDFKNNVVSPTELSRGSHRMVNWMCPSGHVFSKPVRDFIKSHLECPVCKKINA